MPNLQTLRDTRRLARLVLGWFVLALGLATAAPVLHPQALTLVCSAAGTVKLVSGGPDGTAAPAAHSLDCVLCLAMDAPPAQPRALQVPKVQLSYLHPTLDPVASTWQVAAPFPARGPPQAS